MGSLSIWHWLVFLIVGLVAYVIPLALIIGKAGFNRVWSVAFLVPGVNIIGLWVLALVRWPSK